MNVKSLILSVALVGALLAAWAAQADQPDQPTTAPTTQPGATLVNIHLKQATAGAVFAELAKQGEVKFWPDGVRLNQDTSQTLMDVDFTNRPFWLAVRDVCARWRFAVRPSFGVGDKRTINLNYQANGAPSRPLPSCESNGCLIEAVALGRQQDINYNNPNSPRDVCSLQLAVYVDPAVLVRRLFWPMPSPAPRQSGRPSDTRVVYCGDNLEQLANRWRSINNSRPLRFPERQST